jgi:hypothetical protein
MKVLDIDIDLFVDPRPSWRADADRLDSARYRSWSPMAVEDYLTDRCNIQKEHPLPGAIVTEHHELFDRWDSLISTGQLTTPFDLVHIDSHADLGMGDPSSRYIMGDLLHHELNQRYKPRRSGADRLREGNFITFAIAYRWISSIVYVHHPQLIKDNGGLHDIPTCLFRNNDPRCGVLQLKQLPRDCLDGGIRRLQEFEPISLEPEVPIKLVDRDSFSTDDSFSFVFSAQSPRYTPVTADSILNTIRKFIQSN